MRTIKVTVSPLGKPTVEAVGFNGVGCTEATSSIEAALAGSNEPTTRVMKPEYYETESVEQTQGMTW